MSTQDEDSCSSNSAVVALISNVGLLVLAICSVEYIGYFGIIPIFFLMGLTTTAKAKEEEYT
jgi:hypothetical protein